MKGLLFLLAFALVPAAAGPARPPADYTPKDWLAFVARVTPLAVHAGVIERTPQVLVFRSGRVVWRTRELRRGESGRDPDIWREGQADRKALAQFVAAVRKGTFLTAQPGVPEANRARIPNDSPTTYIGVDLGRARRIVNISGLQSQANQLNDTDAYTRDAIATHEAILAVRPANSHRYEPGTIRVAFYPSGLRSGDSVTWPLEDAPTGLDIGRSRYYSGADARAVIAALARSNWVQAGEYQAWVDWAPALNIPVELPAALGKE